MTFSKFCSAVGITASIAFILAYHLVNLLEDHESAKNCIKSEENPDEISFAVCPHCATHVRLTKKT
jgi:hypothetical protein